jgi:putative glycosyltransferase (TIGR04372 family)
MKYITNTIKDKKNKNFKKMKKIFKNFLFKFLFKFFKKSLVFSNISKDEYALGIFEDIRKLNTIKENFKLISKLKKEFPDNIIIQLRYAWYSYLCGKIECFDVIKSYWKQREKYISKNKLEDFDIGLIDQSNMCGSLGNYFYVFTLINSVKLNCVKFKQIILIKNAKNKFTNDTLARYFKKYIKVIEGNYFSAMNKLIEILVIPIGFFCPHKDTATEIHLASNLVYQERLNQKKLGHFELEQEDLSKGRELIKKFGIDENQWFVCLHVREAASKAEGNNEFYRNFQTQHYFKAIEYITEKGGYVFRVGDSSMSKLPKMKNVIDYANHEENCDFLDVYLGARCKFTIATSSGFWTIPYYFNKPVLMTNSQTIQDYYSLTEKDFFLPKFLKIKDSSEYVTVEKYLQPPQGIVSIEVEKLINDYKLEYTNCSSEDLYMATKEINENIDGKNILSEDQIICKKEIENNNKVFKVDLKPYANIPKSYLSKLKDLNN